MPARRTHITRHSSHGQLAGALAALRIEHDVPAEFPAEVLAEAQRAVAEPPAADLRDVPFVTLDPAGSRDLDQALHLSRLDGPSGTGAASTPGAATYLVRYAIADVPGYIRPGGALDREARQRGQTLYLPDGSVPLHPRILSEDRASLLPERDRTAYVWSITLDAEGRQTSVGLERAWIRSRAQLDYTSAQLRFDRQEDPGPLALLPEIGMLRLAQQSARGGASLNLPDEEIERDETGYRIVRRMPVAVEDWNAQLSLLTGMAAARLMLDARIGVLRTMPAPTEEAIQQFRARVRGLGAPWPEGMRYGEYLRTLDRGTARSAAILQAASGLFRGADYAVFDGAVPEAPEQAAIAAPYAHVTAPLRRLVDRWGLVICAAICAGEEVPSWVRASLPELPALMRRSTQRAAAVESAALDRVEAALVRDRIGETFTAVVLERRGDGARVQIADPPITGRIALSADDPDSQPGSLSDVRVVSADVNRGSVVLAAADA